MTSKSALSNRLYKQHIFTRDYSPLCSRLCLLFSEWLSENREPFAGWLLEAASGRAGFEIPMLLNAGLHYLVLTGSSAVSELARYYPSVGGQLSCEDPAFEVAVDQAVSRASGELHRFIRTANVQTNESARGLCWLLPVQYTPWRGIRLLELGTSAGLNLAADERCYRLVDDKSESRYCKVGWGEGEEFNVYTNGIIPEPPLRERVEVTARIGCDCEPFYLHSQDDEKLLASFIWADQTDRFKRLFEGIRAARRLRHEGNGPVLHRALLPGELKQFLFTHGAEVTHPVVLVNTYVKKYLDDKGAELQRCIASWAMERKNDTLWVQMELPDRQRKPPALGWLLWQADLWQQGKHLTFELGWVHPHGTRVHWLAGMSDWIAFWAGQRRVEVS